MSNLDEKKKLAIQQVQDSTYVDEEKAKILLE